MSEFNKRIEKPMKHLFEIGELNVYDKNIINLSAGTPSPRLLLNCCDIFEKATIACMAKEFDNNAFLFQYGPTIGTFEFREKLAEFLTNGYQSVVNYSDLVLSAGATHGMHLILSTLIDLNGFIFVDEVTYMIALEAFKQFSNMTIVPVSLNENGVDVIDLEEKLKLYQFASKTKMFWSVYYTMPTFHNPTGIVFTNEVNSSLIKLARKYDCLIACDDVYNLLSYDDDKPPKRLYEFDKFDDDNFKGNVISNGTFSKILSPGIRVGWMECPPRIVETFRECGVLKSGGAINNYGSGIITSLIELGLAENQLKIYSQNNKEGRDAVCETLEKYLPIDCKYLKPRGGYFVWITLPDNCDANQVNEYCMREVKVVAISGTRFSVEKKFKNFLRVTFAFHEAGVLREATEKLCKGIQEFIVSTNN